MTLDIEFVLRIEKLMLMPIDRPNGGGVGISTV